MVLKAEEYAKPAAPSDPSSFTLGTLVQIESHEGKPLYGTIRWIGALPGYDGYYAGVELVSSLFTVLTIINH